MRKLGLLSKLLLGIIIGTAFGLFVFATKGSVDQSFYKWTIGAIAKLMATFNMLFGNFLKFIVPLVILGFIVPGIADLGRKAGKLLGITALIAYISSIIAGFLAYFVGVIFIPKMVSPDPHIEINEEEVQSLFSPIFELEMPPLMNPMTAIILAFLFGLGLAYIKGKTLRDATEDFKDIIEKVLSRLIIPLIPLHIGGLFAKIAGDGKIISVIKLFSVIFILILILQALYILIQYIVAGAYTGKNPIKAIKNMLPAYLTALGTQSSAATIPVSLETSRANDVEEDVVDFVVPLCANIHLAGDTITLVLGAMGILYLYANPGQSMMEVFGLGHAVSYIMLLGVTMVAAPGIPGGGVITALGLLEGMLGMTTGQQALMIALHFSQDSFGTATNVTGDGAIAIAIDKVAKNIKETSLD